MSRMIRCPRCQSQIDVTNVAGGSTVPCGDCGAMLRVPTGQTGQHPRVPTPAPQPAAAAEGGAKLRERQTPIFRRMAGVRSPAERRGPPRAGAGERAAARRKSSGPVIAIVAAVLAVGLIGLLAFAMVSKSRQQETTEKERQAKAEERDRQKREMIEAGKRQEQEWAAEQERAAKEGKKGPTHRPGGLVKKLTGEYDIPATFEPGARKVAERQVKELYVMPLDANLKKEYESLATAGKVAEIVNEDSKWMPYIIDSILSDDEKISRSTYQALHNICEKRKISCKEDRFENPIKLSNINASYVRGGEYVFWTNDWWAKPNNQAAVRAWAVGPEVVAETPEHVKWEEMVKDLRGGGGYDDPNRPAGHAYQRLKLMGSGAYPHLVKFIDHEDIMIGRAVVSVLNQLTGQQRPLPNEGNKAQMKSEWESYFRK